MKQNNWIKMSLAVGCLLILGSTTATAQPMPEACCLPDGTCQMLPSDICLQMMGNPQGPGSICLGDGNGNGVDDACEGASEPGACCGPDGRCHMALENECLQQGGIFQGPGSMCLGDLDGDGVDDACEGGELKFIQRPDINRTGIDVKATTPNILADDFLCQQRSLITEITVWGSWKNDLIPPEHGVRFTLSIHKDIPANESPTGYSMPGDVLWVRTFQPGDFTHSLYMGGIQEYWWDPFTPQGWIFPGDTQCWQYDFTIPVEEAFCQEGSIEQPLVYWLDVQATPIGSSLAQFGWKTVTSPDSNFNDAAVAGQGVEPYTGPWNKLVYPMPGHVWYLEDIGLAFSIGGNEPCPEEEKREYGDAPEGALAYPSTGIIGQFPTCKYVGPVGSFIEHNNFGAYFGQVLPGFDFELDGNAGFCPLFNPNTYDRDECFQDGDAGLMFPPAFTIQGPVGGEMVVPCSGLVGSLGQTCQTATWGGNIDTWVVNFMPSQTTGYVNVLIDWDQNGVWGGAAQCPLAAAPEHVLVDWPVPNGYVGPLSGLVPPPPPFLIGPNSGYVWARVTITERQLGISWTGTGVFEDGETEDYLLQVDPETHEEYDFGDAPDPTYPTLLASLGAQHVIVPGIMLGNLIDGEADGQPTVNADGDDLANLPDEDGVAFVPPYIPGQPGTVQVTASVAGMLWAWIDFDGNGSWAEAADMIANGISLNPGLNAVAFTVPATAQPGQTYARFRFTTATSVILSYTGMAPDGEVEDYLFWIEEEPGGEHELGDAPDSSNSWGVPMTTYPTAVLARFPTVYQIGSPPFGPIHWQPRAVAWLGQAVTLENEADIGPDQDPTNNIIPPQNAPDLDMADDGVQMPLCLPHCQPTMFNYTVTIVNPPPAQGLFINVWFDWTRNGDWDDTPTCPSGIMAPEWAVQNQPLPILAPGVYTFTTLPFIPWHPVGTTEDQPIWMRITLSEQPWGGSPMPGGGGSGPANGYSYGETEDYYFVPVIPPVITSASSVMKHGAAGDFGIAINMAPPPYSIEPRVENIIAEHRLVFVFDKAINIGGASVTLSSGSIAGYALASTNVPNDTLVATLASAPTNNACWVINVSGVTDASGLCPMAPVTFRVRVIKGDVNASGSVNILDQNSVKGQLAKPVTAANFMNDVDASGSINILDQNAVKANLGKTATCP